MWIWLQDPAGKKTSIPVVAEKSYNPEEGDFHPSETPIHSLPVKKSLAPPPHSSLLTLLFFFLSPLSGTQAGPHDLSFLNQFHLFIKN